MTHSRSRFAAVALLVAGLVVGLVAGYGPLMSAAQAKPVPGYQLMTVDLGGGKKVVARWNPCQTAITYQVNLSGVARAKRAALLKEVRAGFGRLAAADGLTYRYTGTTTFVPMRNNLASAPAEIVVAAVARNRTDLGLSDNSLGFGGVMWSTWSGGSSGSGAAVVRGYVVLDPAGLSRLKAGFGRGKTQGNVILHELAHATGLEHVGSTHELMNPTLTGSAPDGYGRGDRAGLKRVGGSAGCIAIPTAVTIADLS